MSNFLPTISIKMSFSSFGHLLPKFTLKSLYFFFRLYALDPISTVPLVYEIYATVWSGLLVLILSLTFSSSFSVDDRSIGSLVSYIQFIMLILSNIISIGESYFTQRKQKEFFESLIVIDNMFKNNLKHPLSKKETERIIAKDLFWVYTVLMLTTMGMTYAHQATLNITILFWYTFLSTQALRLRCAQLLIFTINVNVRLNIISKIILKITKDNSLKNKHQIKLIEFDNNPDEECKRIAYLTIIYNQLFRMVTLINDCFGLSMLAIYSSYFVDFITNCYWVFLSKTVNGPYETYILNGGLVGTLMLQLTVVCWHCQECTNYSKYIGCSIFKLSKPFGNKRYNDLVSEFSLQALHQTFAVSAKEFFNLNLDLLGSMIGAVVTYLVILIQFMFTEKSGSKISVPNSVVGAVAEVALKNQTKKN